MFVIASPLYIGLPVTEGTAPHPRRISERDPDIEEQRVVVARIATRAVVVGLGTVELGVAGVLQEQAQVLKVLNREPIELHDVAGGVRSKRVAFGVVP